jgi:CHAT domain-containing protein/Tfp pilus assembly protein PilF
VVRLEPGKHIEKTLAGGASDSYGIQAGAGQFLHAIVDQLGIDVALTLYGPDGKQIGSMDSPNGAFGLEQISTIADLNGTYKLEVASSDKNAPAGRYRISINPPRLPTDADRARISAEHDFAEAVQLTAQGSADSLRRATQKYEATLPLWRSTRDPYEEAVTLNSIGEVYGPLGDIRKALDCFNQALPLWRAVGDRNGEAAALVDIGTAFYFLGQMQDALDYFSQGLLIQRSVGDSAGEAATLNNIGPVYNTLGESQRAIDSYNQALPLWRAVGDHRGEARTLTNIGAAYDDLGEEQRALDYYNQALPLWRAVADRSGEATTLSNIGAIYATLAASQKALKYYEQALPLLRAVGDRQQEATTLSNVGFVYAALGENQKALDYHYQALPLRRLVGDRVGEASTLSNIGFVYAALGENQRALDLYDQALQIDRAIGDRDLEAITLINVSYVDAALGDKHPALEHLSHALALAREVKNPLREASALSGLMAFWRNEGQPATGIFFGKQAVNEIQQLRANIQGLEKETRQSFLKSKEKTYRDLTDLLITQGRLPEAQEVLDLLKNEEYFEFIRRDDKNISSSTAPVNLTKSEEALSREYEENAGRVTAIGNEWAALRSKPSRTPEEEKHLVELSDQLKSANGAWEKFLSGLYAELGKSKEAQTTVENVQESASGMQRVVRQLNSESGAGVVALYTLVGDEKYRIIVVTPTVMVAREYPIKAEDLRKKVFEFRQSLVNPWSDPVPKAQELYRILVGPAAQDLAGAKAEMLMWSLDDVLRYLPMAALHDGHQYLVEKYTNEIFTPASVASLTERPNVNGWRGLGMGVSKSYGDFSALPSVPEELHRIIRDKNISGAVGVLPGQTMLDETFTEDGMKKALELNYPLVHIASHFAFAAGNETNSFLLLGGKDPQGEHLTLAEIRKDPAFSFADTELLTLSACNTAVSGPAGDGREVDGLGILAQQKGARAVVASLWGVYDPSTGVLMQEFYKRWTTHSAMTKAEALREAQLALLRGTSRAASEAGATDKHSAHPVYAHPFYWAPFILIGNWR